MRLDLIFPLSHFKLYSIVNSGFRFSGLISERATPVPIPNTEVKPFCADGTARAAVWESRTRPGFYSKRLQQKLGAFFLCYPAPVPNFPFPLIRAPLVLCFDPHVKTDLNPL